MSDVKKERDFIHALASPLAGIEMILESIVDDVTEAGPDELGVTDRVRDALTGIEKLRKLLEDRREEVLNGK